MACMFIDSFAHYSTSYIVKKYTTNDSATIHATNGPFGGPCLEFGGGSFSISKTFANTASWIIGFRFYVSTLASGPRRIITLKDNATIQVELVVNSDGTLSVRRNGTVLTNGTSVTAISTATWYHIQFKVTIANSISANSCKVRLNNSDIITVATSQDTQNTANAYANNLMIWNDGSSSSLTARYADLYVLDSSGSVNNDFLGELRVGCIFPSGNGNSSQWVGSDGNSTDNYALVDDTAPNDDTDYVESSVANDIDSYTFGDLSNASSIAAIQHTLYARKTDGGTRTITPHTRISSTNYTGTNINLADTYEMLTQVVENSPATSSAWTQSEINGAEFGVKLIA